MKSLSLKRFTTGPEGLLIGMSLVAVAIEILPTIAGGYGYFIDEWYYIACAKRLAFGYVDHPPLSPLILRVVMAVAGGSLVAIRVLPALCYGATVYLTGRIARALGGGTYAQALAALCAMISPAVAIPGGFFSMNPFEIVLWAWCILLLLRILRDGDARSWLLFGLLLGLGLENKHTMVVFGIAVWIGLLLTPARKQLMSKHFWMGWGVVVLLIMPNLLWQATNGWPSLEFYRNATLLKNVPTPPVQGFLNQVLTENPFTAFIWLGGLVLLFVWREWRPFRPLALTSVALFVFMLASQSSRADRITGIYPLLFAAGCVGVERLAANNALRWLKPSIPAFLLLGGILLAPIALPLLPPDALAHYAEALHLVPQLERGKTSPLPQWFADRFDWDETVATVRQVYEALPPADKERAVIFAPSYGHAGALEFYGPALGLPRVISNNNSYYLWSKGHANADVLIAIGGAARDWRHVYADVDSVATLRGTYGMSWRRNMPVYVLRRPTTPLDDIWDRVKHYE